MAEGSTNPVAAAHVEIGLNASGIAPGIEAAKQHLVGGVQNMVGAVGGIGLGTIGIFAGLAAGIGMFANSAIQGEANAMRFNLMLDRMVDHTGYTSEGI